MNPAKREVCAVIRFLMTKNLIHHELCTVYGQSIMIGGVVCQWICLFKSGRTNIHDEERVYDKSGVES